MLLFLPLLLLRLLLRLLLLPLLLLRRRRLLLPPHVGCRPGRPRLFAVAPPGVGTGGCPCLWPCCSLHFVGQNCHACSSNRLTVAAEGGAWLLFAAVGERSATLVAGLGGEAAGGPATPLPQCCRPAHAPQPSPLRRPQLHTTPCAPSAPPQLPNPAQSPSPMPSSRPPWGASHKWLHPPLHLRPVCR